MGTSKTSSDKIFSQWLAQSRSWARNLVQRSRLESEMDEELRNHLALRTEALIAEGYERHDAERQARMELGPVLTNKENMRASVGLRLVDELSADVRFGIRLLIKTPGFTAIAVSSLALAIGANTAIFSVAKDVLYNRLEVVRPAELRMLAWHGDGKRAIHGMWGSWDNDPNSDGVTAALMSYPMYKALREHNSVLGDIAGYKEQGMNGTIRGNALRVSADMVSGNFYSVLEVRPQLGRPILPSDDGSPGTGTVAVISDELWSHAFGRSPDAIGQTITLNQAIMTIVGVNPPGFTGAKNVLESPHVFVPMSMEPLLVTQREKLTNFADPGLWWVDTVARLKPGIPESTATAALAVEFEAAFRATMKIEDGETIPRFLLQDGSRGLHFSDELRKPIYVLWALTGCVLLLACANVANLLLSRGAQRRREMSVRLALGASRRRVLRQLLTESLLLSALGGVAGLVLGYCTRNVLPNLFSGGWDSHRLDIPFDWGAFAFTSAITLAAGVLFGLAPAWFAARTEVSSSLKESAHTTTRRRKGLSGKAIVAFQIMLSTLLVVGAGLFLRTLHSLNSIDPGFDTRNLILFDVNPPSARYPGNKAMELHREIEERIAALPGVISATAAGSAYLTNGASNYTFVPEGEQFDKNKRQSEFMNSVGPRFFETLKISMIAGRVFRASDTLNSPRVGIINESLARTRFAGRNPVGLHFRTGNDPKSQPIEIVGICADTYYDSLKRQPPAQFLLPYAQQADTGGMTYQVRTQLSLTELEPTIRKGVQGIDRDLPVIDLRTEQQQIDQLLQTERALAMLGSGFGILALSLAAVGIYGVMSYQVAQRTSEIGLRIALGALPRQVRGMILRESTWVTCAGVVAGLAAAFTLTRLVGTMLYGVKPNDPLTLIAGTCVLLFVALVSTWIPARRAARVQPMEALRHE